MAVGLAVYFDLAGQRQDDAKFGTEERWFCTERCTTVQASHALSRQVSRRRATPSHQASHVEPSEPLSEPRRAPTTSTTSRAAPLSSDHVDHIPSSSVELRPRRPRPEQLCRALTTSTTRLCRNDDRREERRYDNRDHSHGDRSKSSRTGQLHRQRHVKPSLEHRNTPTTPTGRQ